MIIRAHSVPMLPSGLSPMQERLLCSEKFVRLVSAPTGSGKSYAFMRAVLDEDANVLFIVPTKRLLQNLIEDALEQTREQLRGRGLADAQIAAWTDERITEWSGNQPADGSESLAVARARQLLSGGGGAGGRVIFAIPEVVVKMISGVRITGASAGNPFLYPRTFDHIVFDEFHTIDDRSFGLACLFSLLAVTERQGKVSLLSATPIDVAKVLKQAGVEADDIEMIAEGVVDGHPSGHRPIHGDVAVALRECSIPESIALNLDAVRGSITGGRTVIVIYDSLQRLIQEEPVIRQTLSKIGVHDERILDIHSIADSKRGPGEPRRGRRYADPRAYDVLLCTSSVEVRGHVPQHTHVHGTRPRARQLRAARRARLARRRCRAGHRVVVRSATRSGGMDSADRGSRRTSRRIGCADIHWGDSPRCEAAPRADAEGSGNRHSGGRRSDSVLSPRLMARGVLGRSVHRRRPAEEDGDAEGSERSTASDRSRRREIR